MKPWMWRALEVCGTVLAAADVVLLPACWLVVQSGFTVIAWGIWRTTSGWHGVAGAAVFTLFTTLLWGIFIFTEWRRSFAVLRERRTAKKPRSHARENAWFRI